MVGCGYVADFYVATLANHPTLELAGVTDRDPARASRFAAYHKVCNRGSLDAILADPTIELVVNLTNPRSHYAVSRACLEAGKHVYSEKPLATVWEEALALVELAEARGLQLASAPCTVLGEAAQTLWREVRRGRIGEVRLAYAELDDGMLHRENYRAWVGASGSPWPYRDEFEVGCTIEHAGYYVSWLAAMFGPVESATAFSSCQIPDKAPDGPVETPDFSVGVLRFASGVVARLTCGIIGSHDHSLRLFGLDGTLTVRECFNFASPVMARQWTPWSFRREVPDALAPGRARPATGPAGAAVEVPLSRPQHQED